MYSFISHNEKQLGLDCELYFTYESVWKSGLLLWSYCLVVRNCFIEIKYAEMVREEGARRNTS